MLVVVYNGSLKVTKLNTLMSVVNMTFTTELNLVHSKNNFSCGNPVS